MNLGVILNLAIIVCTLFINCNNTFRYLDLNTVKDIMVGGRHLEIKEVQELVSAAKRYGLEIQGNDDLNIITIVHGNNLSDNRIVYLMMPTQSFRFGLVFIIHVMYVHTDNS